MQLSVRIADALREAYTSSGRARIAMGPCLDNGFINWDETEYITRNPKIKTLTLESVKNIFSAPDPGMYSPLTALSYALEYLR